MITDDLYFRLHVIEIHLAPLRERRDDILPLALEFLRRLVRDEGSDLAGWSAEVEAWLLAHDWPGNVRELQHAIERGAVLAEGDRIELYDLAPSAGASPGEKSAPLSLAGHLDRAQKEHIRHVLTDVGGKAPQRRFGPRDRSHDALPADTQARPRVGVHGLNTSPTRPSAAAERCCRSPPLTAPASGRGTPSS